MNSRLFDRDHLVSAFLACRDANQRLLSGQASEDTLLTQLLVRIVAKNPNNSSVGQKSIPAR
jgi:hypothetical protein